MIFNKDKTKKPDKDETLRMVIDEKLKNYVPYKEPAPAKFKIDETPDVIGYVKPDVWNGRDR